MLAREILYSHYQDKAVPCNRLVVSLPVNVCTCWSGRYCILTIRTRLCLVTGKLLVYQSMSARAGQGDIVFSLSEQGSAMLQVSC